MSLAGRGTASGLVAQLRPGMTVYVPGMSGESLAFYAALQANPEAAAGVRFAGVHFPGINRSDYLGLHSQARRRAYFMQSGLRKGFADGRAELLPLDHPGIYADLAEHVTVDIAIAQITPPDDRGACSLGPCADFLPAVWNKAGRRWGHINPRLPRTHGSFHIDATDLDAVFEDDSDVLACDVGSGHETARDQAAFVASLVRDGDTLECGIGKLPTAILSALHGHRDLRFHSGLASASVIPLLDGGSIRRGPSIECGVALGDAAFYRRLSDDDSFFFRPVSETHDIRRIAAIRGFCAINSAIEVDLFGQVNADSIQGRSVAGVGGLPAFVSGARLSTGGRSIIVLPAATDDGTHSRIVSTLGSSAAIAIPRHDADYVVTEHGIAALRACSVQARARALIDIAAPQFREGLDRAWHNIEQRL